MSKKHANALAEQQFGGHELVFCIDGPRSGGWYFLRHGSGSWHELMRLAEHNGETPRTGRTLGYVPTRETVPHPQNPLVEGHVLAWSPAAAEKGRRAA